MEVKWMMIAFAVLFGFLGASLAVQAWQDGQAKTACIQSGRTVVNEGGDKWTCLTEEEVP